MAVTDDGYVDYYFNKLRIDEVEKCIAGWSTIYNFSMLLG